jgi:hypothetical protein
MHDVDSSRIQCLFASRFTLYEPSVITIDEAEGDTAYALCRVHHHRVYAIAIYIQAYHEVMALKVYHFR